MPYYQQHKIQLFNFYKHGIQLNLQKQSMDFFELLCKTGKDKKYRWTIHVFKRYQMFSLRCCPSLHLAYTGSDNETWKKFSCRTVLIGSWASLMEFSLEFERKEKSHQERCLGLVSIWTFLKYFWWFTQSETLKKVVEKRK